MSTTNVTKYVIEPDELGVRHLALTLADGTEVVVNVDIATTLADDVFHAMYTGTDDCGIPIRRITRTLDETGDHFLDVGEEVELEFPIR